MIDRQIEILAPAGSLESLKAAVCAGADAVYIGGTRFGARAYAKNLTEDELLWAIDYVHIHGRRIYLTVNTLLKDSETEELYEYLLPYYLKGLDGVIVQDMGVLEYLRRYFPDLNVHGSTQMTITGADGAEFLKRQGVVRVVPARELSLNEIRRMKEQTGIEIECFVHGALCYCYSGQCLLSSMIGGRSGNRGQCAQPCRLPWQAEGRKAEDLMSLKDLCTIDMLPKFIEGGIDSFKIEGRMKQPDYVYTVTSVYRKYADLYLEKGIKGYKVEKADRDRLYGAYQRRGYTDGYYGRHNGKEMVSFQRMSGEKEENHLQEFKIQEKINGNLILSVGERAKLVLTYHDLEVECKGGTVQPAMRQPLDVERTEKQMRKTGGTEFRFEKFWVEMDGECFLPVQALNELRRDGLQRLTEAILDKYHRKESEAPACKTGGQGLDLELKGCKEDGRRLGLCEIKDEDSHLGVQKEYKPYLSCVVLTFPQLKAVIDCGNIGTIYIDDELGVQEPVRQYLSKYRKAHRYFLAMPHIFRMADMKGWEDFYGEMESFYDGVLLRNWESYQWLLSRGYKKDICSDSNLYVFNRYGKTFMKKQGISRFTASAELNVRELKRLGIQEAALQVYGYQPVMVTANCIQKTTGRCQKEEGVAFLTDRYLKRFAVRRCCRYCYNVIYNSAPLFLADKEPEIRGLMPEELRLDFTIETKEQVREITRLYEEAFLFCQDVAPPQGEYTRGHFKRGVK